MSRAKSTVASLTVLSIVALAAFAGCAANEASAEEAADSVQPITAMSGMPPVPPPSPSPAPSGSYSPPGMTNVQVACPKFTKQGASTPSSPYVGPGGAGPCEPYSDMFGNWHIQGWADTCMCTYSTDDPANATSCASKGYMPGAGATSCPTWGYRGVACTTSSGGNCGTGFTDLGSNPSAADKQNARLWCQNSLNAQCKTACGQGTYPTPMPSELSCRK